MKRISEILKDIKNKILKGQNREKEKKNFLS